MKGLNQCVLQRKMLGVAFLLQGDGRCSEGRGRALPLGHQAEAEPRASGSGGAAAGSPTSWWDACRIRSRAPAPAPRGPQDCEMGPALLLTLVVTAQSPGVSLRRNRPLARHMGCQPVIRGGSWRPGAMDRSLLTAGPLLPLRSPWDRALCRLCGAECQGPGCTNSAGFDHGTPGRPLENQPERLEAVSRSFQHCC